MALPTRDGQGHDLPISGPPLQVGLQREPPVAGLARFESLAAAPKPRAATCSFEPPRGGPKVNVWIVFDRSHPVPTNPKNILSGRPYVTPADSEFVPTVEQWVV